MDWLSERIPIFRIIWLYGLETTIESRLSKLISNPETQSTPIIFAPCDTDMGPLEIFYFIGAELVRGGYVSKSTQPNPPTCVRLTTFAEVAAAEFWKHIGYPIISGVDSRCMPSLAIIIALDKCRKYGTIEVILSTITEALLGFDLPLRFIITTCHEPRTYKISNRPQIVSSLFTQYFVGTCHLRWAQTIDTAIFRYVEQKSSSGEDDVTQMLMSTLMGRSIAGYWQPYLKIAANFVRATNNLEESGKRIANLFPNGTATLTCDIQNLDDLFIAILSTILNPKLLIIVLGVFFAVDGRVDIIPLLDQIFSVPPDFSYEVLNVLALCVIDSDRQGSFLRPRDLTPFFSDFLLTRTRSQKFYVDTFLFHEAVAVHGFSYIIHHTPTCAKLANNATGD